MHAGTPVIASDAGALPEVCGDAARYVDPRDPASIARALTDLAGVPPLREELRRRGTARARAFTWRACAEAHVRAYALALGR
jgi:glycosyltransferase involved in cell wall biosynthesis